MDTPSENLGLPLSPSGLLRKVTRSLHLHGPGNDLYKQLLTFVEQVSYYAVFMIDQSGEIKSWNPGVESILGYTAAEFIGMNAAHIFTLEDRSVGAHLAEMGKALENGGASDLRWHVRKDGSRFWADGLLTAIKNEDGELTSFIKIMRDATSQKNAEDALKRREEELAHANQIKDVFIATLSHELRNPLNIIMGFTEILKEELAPSESIHLEAIEAIERSARLQNQLVNDLLDISRIISGKFELEKQETDLVPILESILKAASVSVQKKNIHLYSNIEACEGMLIDGDPGRLQQVIMNIINNAIKFTPEGGKIDVLLEVDSQRKLVHLVVKDTGKGISSDFLPFVFERFHQQPGGTTKKYGGLGLGLSIARELVEMHGGQIDALSDGEGCGATIKIHLPYIEARH